MEPGPSRTATANREGWWRSVVKVTEPSPNVGFPPSSGASCRSLGEKKGELESVSILAVTVERMTILEAAPSSEVLTA